MSRLGRHVVTAVAGERVNAFVPPPLPPHPPIDLAGLQVLLERANQAVGRLDGAAMIVPNPQLFIFMAVRKEALLSSQIEGTQSSLSDLLLFETQEAFDAPLDDIMEVSNYISAMNHGLDRLRDGFPLCLRLMREIHEVLLRRGRGSDKEPGEFRRSQNWIGGSRPGNASFVPPPPDELDSCLAALERFIHADSHLPLLVRAALVHVQFETIHPFLDGNGRLGRLLITFMLCDAGVLREPVLYLSLHLKLHRRRYYDLLQTVRETGAWEEWLAFFLEGVAETADGAATAIKQMVQLFNEDRSRVQQMGRAAGTCLRLLGLLERAPIVSVSYAAHQLGLSFPTTSSAMTRLIALGLVRELTGRLRGRSFAYAAYLSLLSEGTEPLSPTG